MLAQQLEAVVSHICQLSIAMLSTCWDAGKPRPMLMKQQHKLKAIHLLCRPPGMQGL